MKLPKSISYKAGKLAQSVVYLPTSCRSASNSFCLRGILSVVNVASVLIDWLGAETVMVEKALEVL